MELLTDITPLREIPAFRRLWLGSMLSSIGGAMTTFAMTLQVWEITRSTAAVGWLGVATLVPMLVIALPGGTLADRIDRRKLVLGRSRCSRSRSRCGRRCSRWAWRARRTPSPSCSAR